MRHIFDNINSSELTISDLRLWVHLGCSEGELHHPQPAALNIHIYFHKILEAAKTDELKDGYCYARAAKLIKKIAHKKQYNLIEHLAEQVHTVLYLDLLAEGYSDFSIKIIVTKLAPPVSEIHGGISFTYWK